MTCCSWIENPIGLLWTITEISTRTFSITRQMYHRCIHILIMIVSTVLGLFFGCTITPFIETDFLSSFVVIFRWFRAVNNYMILRSASKTFAMWVFSSLYVRITSRASVILIFSLLFLISIGWEPPQKNNFTWTRFDLSLFLSELLSRFK